MSSTALERDDAKAVNIKPKENSKIFQKLYRMCVSRKPRFIYVFTLVLCFIQKVKICDSLTNNPSWFRAGLLQSKANKKNA